MEETSIRCFDERILERINGFQENRKLELFDDNIS